MMTSVDLKPRDPMTPGAPIIPRREWDLPPYHRWSFQHVREMTATAQVWRGPGSARPLPAALSDLSGLSFDLDGRRRTVGDFLDGSFTDAFLVLHRGQVVSEVYHNGMKPHGTHLSMSVTKSFVGILVGILAGEGVVDIDAPVTHYLPELHATAYRGATVRHLLDMTSGVTFDETYGAFGSHIQMLDQACGWKPRERPDWPRTMWELVLSLTQRERAHGALFSYRSIETDVLGFLVERVTATPLAELLAERIWQPMGAGEDGYITVDEAGTALADGGLCATLRDFGRFGLLLAEGGARDGRQVVPAGWIEATRQGDRDRFQGVYRTILPDGAYSNQFWIEDSRRRALWARGIFGQSIYVDPEASFVVVKLSTWPEFTDPGRSLEFLAAVRAVRRELAGV